MNLSLDKNDPAYSPGVIAKCYLNGVQVDRVITAYEDLGFLVRYQADENGRIKLNESRTEALRETLHGDVRIELIRGRPR